MPASVLPFVSVVVPTYRSWDLLADCIDALILQDYPLDRFEVIVINNCPGDSCPEYLAKLFVDNFIIIEEGEPGSYCARNSGINISRGDLFAFTDSDCRPSCSWLTKMVHLHLAASAEVIAGNINVVCGIPKTMPDCYEVAFSFNQMRRASKGLSVTANLLAARRVFDVVGLFRHDILSGGDWDWCRRAKKAGFSMEYCDEAVVDHPSRSTWTQLLKKSKRINSSIDSRKNLFFEIVKRIFGLVTIFFPPINKLALLFYVKRLTFFEKINAFVVAYILRIYSKLIQVMAVLKIIEPSRS